MNVSIKDFTISYIVNTLRLFDNLEYKYVKYALRDFNHNTNPTDLIQPTIPVLINLTRLNTAGVSIKFTFSLIYDRIYGTGVLAKKHIVEKHFTTSRFNRLGLFKIFDETAGASTIIQSLVRGMITRKKIHIALLSSESDALPIAISSIVDNDDDFAFGG